MTKEYTVSKLVKQYKRYIKHHKDNEKEKQIVINLSRYPANDIIVIHSNGNVDLIDKTNSIN